MHDLRKNGSTSNVLRFVLRHSTTGQGLTGLSSASSGLIISTIADPEASATTYTVAGSTIESITTLGTFAAPTATKCRFKEVDATNHPGLYEFQFADARFAVSNAKRLRISVSGATNLLSREFIVRLSANDIDDAVRMGMSALPNAAADAAGGLPISDAGGLDLDAILADTADMQPKLGTPAASVSADIAAVKVDTAATLVDTAEIGAAGAGLTALATAANLATVAGYLDTEIAAILADTNELQTDWANGGRLDLILDARASQTSVDDLPTNAELATALAAADDAVLSAIAALNNLSAAQVNAEVVDALATDTYAEPAQGAPGATITLAAKIGFLYKAFRNKIVQSASSLEIYNDDAATVDHKASVSDSGTAFTRGEMATGP